MLPNLNWHLLSEHLWITWEVCQIIWSLTLSGQSLKQHVICVLLYSTN